MRNLFAGILVLFTVTACASWDARKATPGQQAFAVASDYAALSGTAAAYVVLPTADERVKSGIKRADAKAYPAVQIMKSVASGELPDFCGGQPPDDVGLSFAAAACSNDLPVVVRQTRLLVSVLATAVGGIDQ